MVRDIANRWFRHLGITPRTVAEADGHEALLTLVALGYGTGIIPDLVLQNCSIQHRLHATPAPSIAGDLTIGAFIRRTDLHRPLVAAAWAATGPGQPMSEH
ncbi:LysR substrate-binding domain-containing protein [Streptomyces gilvus]|uniref:LysR substrate-binding domain-containing protein n=1 Tax=Streptomyces gilvus TaxID=2920937 RepID=UPI0023F2AD2E|nr:LysR substrate-binding domain-containing protein [Streptomyces sp. CME 23]